MSQALYSAMSGINAGTTQIEVISNNVANINTTGFKSSAVTFEDLYSTTMSYGSAPLANAGGINPMQIGVGTKVSAISTDFSNGSVNTTGKNTDLMIQGDGFFAVKSPDNIIYYTRAGNFSWDADGNLCTTEGYKVAGTDSIFSAGTSGDTVYVPNSIVPIVEGNTNINSTKVSDLNGISSTITQGTFYLTIVGSGGTTVKGVTLGETELTGEVSGLISSINTQLSGSGVTASAADGIIKLTVDGSTATSITFGSLDNPNTTNFLKVTGLANALKENNAYSSNILDYSCKVTDIASAATSYGISNTSINSDGSVKATYQNGDSLSVMLGNDGLSYNFVYTTEAGIKITGSSLEVSQNVAIPANFVIQMARFVNNEGLIAVGSNLFASGPNTGDITFTVGNQMGTGAISSGTLEASNVDLTQELSYMILAQRAVQANSRVFTTASEVLQTIVNMGR